jgi:hypothetical protein
VIGASMGTLFQLRTRHARKWRKKANRKPPIFFHGSIDDLK